MCGYYWRVENNIFASGTRINSETGLSSLEWRCGFRDNIFVDDNMVTHTLGISHMLECGGIVGAENSIFASGTLGINSETGLNNTLSVEVLSG